MKLYNKILCMEAGKKCGDKSKVLVLALLRVFGASRLEAVPLTLDFG